MSHDVLHVAQIPIGAEETFQGMVDLVRMKGITWDGEVTIFVCCLLLNLYVHWTTKVQLRSIDYFVGQLVFPTRLHLSVISM